MNKAAAPFLRNQILLSLGAGALLPSAAAALPNIDDPAAALQLAGRVAMPRPRAPVMQLPGGPLAFEQNRGQFPAGTDYVARAPGYELLLGATGTRLGLRREATPGATHVPAWLVVRLAGANAQAQARPHLELPSRAHYYLGSEPSAWIRDVPHFRRVEYQGVYEGIDLVYYGRDGELEYDFVVHPGADPSEIRLRIGGAEGAEITQGGDLRIRTADGSFTHRRPIAFQTIDGEVRPVEARFELDEDEGEPVARVAVGPHDSGHALVIDPVLAYSSFLGSSGSEFQATVAVDAAGSVYMAGTTSLTGGIWGDTSGFVTKLSPVADPSVEYTVYLGGSGTDVINALAIGASGDVFVAGRTTSADLPTCLAATDCAAYGGLEDAFVAKLSPAGALLYSRYLGGSGNENAAAIVADSFGNFYVAGDTDSYDFPVSAAYQPFFGGSSSDIFLAKFNSLGGTRYSTYLGSSGNDVALALAIGSSGDDVYVAGYSQVTSVDLPVPGALQPFFGGGTWDGYVAHFGSAGALYSATRLGGSGDDFIEAIASGPAGVIVAGRTTSSNFPIASAAQPTLAGGQDAFVTWLSPALNGLVRSTYLGSSGADAAFAVLADPGGDTWVAGAAGTFDFPQVSPFAPPPPMPGASDAFVARYSAAGTLLNSGRIGGSGTDEAFALAADTIGGVVVAGHTNSPDFFTRNAFQPAKSGGYDSFLLRIEPDDTLPDAFAFLDQSNVPLGVVVTSNAVVPTGFNTGVPISVMDGAYSINGGPFVTQPGTLNPGDSVRVQHVSASAAGEHRATILTIGLVSDVFVSTTATVPALLAVAGGAAQSTPVGQPFPSALSVVARDVNGTPMPGILVTFSPPVSGASASLGALQVYTDSSGEATTTASANLVFGTYQVTASAAGLGTPANFPLTNLAAILQIGATNVDFGLVPVGSRSSAPFIVTNGGNAYLTVSAGVLGSTEFSLSGTCSGFVGPGDTCHVIVTYTPAVDGLAGGAVQFSSNSFEPPGSVALSGTGADLSNAYGDPDKDGIPNGVEPWEGRNPLVKDNDIFAAGAASARLFAMQQYRDFLGREGDEAGIQGWADVVASGAWTRAQVIDAFLLSEEFAGTMAPVTRLYFAAYLRVPDYEGLMYNADLVRDGTVTLAQLADYFAGSPEFVALYGALDNTQFVTLLYQNVLGRAPDPGGLAAWVAVLDGGASRGQVLLGFSESAEYKAATENEVLVTMMYSGMLRRTAELTGFNGWVAFLDAGTYTREQVINGFFLSTEYRARFLP